MIIPDKEELMKEIKVIDNLEIRETILALYNHVSENVSIESPTQTAENLLKSLFPSPFTTDIMIPYSFHQTAIGKLIFYCIYNLEKYYTMNELIEFTKNEEQPKGFTRQFLGQEIKSEKLKGIRSGGRWLFTEKQINDYLTFKKFKTISERQSMTK